MVLTPMLTWFTYLIIIIGLIFQFCTQVLSNKIKVSHMCNVCMHMYIRVCVCVYVCVCVCVCVCACV